MKTPKEIAIDFAEGRMTIEEFKEIIDNNDDVYDFFNNAPDASKYLYLAEYGFKSGNLLRDENIGLISSRANIYGEVCRVLRERMGIDIIEPKENYMTIYGFFLDFQPAYIEGCNDEYVTREVYEKIPVELKSKTARIKWAKQRIKELFRCENRPPRWVQSSQWPFDKEGNPMVFLYQKSAGKDDERVFYYFRDETTGEVVEIVDFW